MLPVAARLWASVKDRRAPGCGWDATAGCGVIRLGQNSSCKLLAALKSSTK
jgi:hypothetical protein